MGYKYTKIQEYARIGIWKIKDIILNIIRGFHIEGLQVYEEYKSIQDFGFKRYLVWGIKDNNLSLSKGASILIVYKYTKNTRVYKNLYLEN